MPRKPTEPYGHIAFGKDGKVRKVIRILPEVKSEQEIEVGAHFASGLEKITDCQYETEPCNEDDHDFWLRAEDKNILVQATEIVSRDYLRPLSVNDYRNGNHRFTNFVQKSPDEIYGVDLVARDNLLVDRLNAKIEKHYSKPQDPFWLLIWTVCSDFHCFWIEGGKSQVSPGVRLVREYIEGKGAGPFDEVWFLQLDLKPNRIWPV